MVPPIVRGPPNRPPRPPAVERADEADETDEAAGRPAEYTVKPGDSLSKIAVGLRGDERFKSLSVHQLVDLLRQNNPQVTTPTPKGPRREADGHWIYPGEKLKLPDPPAPPTPPTVPDTAPPAPAPGGSGQVPGNTPPAPAPGQVPGNTPPAPAPGSPGWVAPSARQPPPAVAAGAAAPASASSLKAQIEANFGMYKAALEKPVDEHYLARMSAVEGDLDKMEEAAKGLPKDQDPTRTFAYQKLRTMLESELAKIEKAESDAAGLVKGLEAADKKPGGLTKAEAIAVVEALNRLEPMIRDPDTLFGPAVPLLKKAGVLTDAPPERRAPPSTGPVAAPSAGQVERQPSGPPTGGGIPQPVIAQLQAQMKSGAYSPELAAKVNAAVELAATNTPENVTKARELIVSVLSSQEYQSKLAPKK